MKTFLIIAGILAVLGAVFFIWLGVSLYQLTKAIAEDEGF